MHSFLIFQEFETVQLFVFKVQSKKLQPIALLLTLKFAFTFDILAGHHEWLVKIGSYVVILICQTNILSLKDLKVAELYSSIGKIVT